MTRPEQGFTLIEVLVALLVFAVAAGSAMTALTQALDTQLRMEERILGEWVAQNHFHDLLLSGEFPRPGSDRSQRLEFGFSTWRVQSVFSATTDPDLLRVEIQVLLLSEESSRERPAASLTAFMGRPPAATGADPT